MTDPVEYVEWVDSAGSDSWVSRGELNDVAKVSRVRSAGILVAEDDESITLAEGVDETHNNVHHPITIPKLAITSREVIRGGGSGD